MASQKKNAASSWQSSINPLRGITSRQIDQLLDQARRGNETRLQEAYIEMERTMPIMVVGIQRRTGGLLSKDWKISTRSHNRTRDFDETLAKEQAKYLESIYGDSEERGLYAAIQHMAMAMFRGYSAIKPLYGDDGETLSFEHLDNWNLCRDDKGNFYWNPEADTMKVAGDPGIPLVSSDEIVALNYPYPIDMPGMQIYLRQLVGEEQWARATEKYGVAQVVITAPEGVGDDKISEYAQRASSIFEGGSGAVGYGSTVTQLTDARGQDPFTEFCNHQTDLILMLATGGTLGSKADATGMGSGVSESQDATFEGLLRQDAQLISAAINKTITKHLLDAKWPGKKHLAYFDFNLDSQLSASDILRLANDARSAGFMMNADEISEKIGFTLTPFVEPQGQTIPYNGTMGSTLNSDTEPVDETRKSDPEKPSDVILNDEIKETASSDTADKLTDQLALAFGARFLPIADEFGMLARLTGEEQIEQAKRIQKILDTMDIDDSDPMVTIIHEIMAKTFAGELAK